MSKNFETVLVMGASPNPSRYAYKATVMLHKHGHKVIPYGKRKGEIEGHEIVHDLPKNGIDTVTMYLGAERQKEYHDYFLRLKPKRIIFNPGAENQELADLAQNEGIETENACTLVLLSIGAF